MGPDRRWQKSNAGDLEPASQPPRLSDETKLSSSEVPDSPTHSRVREIQSSGGRIRRSVSARRLRHQFSLAGGEVNTKDRNLGMDRPISRRDFLNGVAAAAAGALAAGGTRADPLSPLLERAKSKGVYPPLRTGARGSHPGSFEVAHQLGREGRRDFGATQEADSNLYDLIVVGAGISGLSAAHFYRKQKPNARILLIDNHDDFGGHARRNEFQVAGRTLISHGGSQTLQEPAQYSDVTKGLLRDLGVETKRFEQAYVHDFFRKHGLGVAPISIVKPMVPTVWSGIRSWTTPISSRWPPPSSPRKRP